jgi:hypothetical protein
MGSDFVRYRPRPARCLGVRDVAGYRLKTYSILYGDRPLDPERFERGMARAAEELPRPALAAGRPGVGFVIVHQGRTGDYLVLGWWDGENELPLRVFVCDGEAWRPARGGEGACVWDLRVVWHEREAYVATVLAGGTADDYLGRAFDGDA